MPSITYDSFDVGLDRRRPTAVSKANRLYELSNAYVTTGKLIAKRPGLTLVKTLAAGTVGLASGNGVLNTFQAYTATPADHADSNYKNNLLIQTASAAYSGGTLSKIHFAETFAGYLYVVAEYSDGVVQHYYINTANPNFISDSNCPQTKAVLRQQNRMFAVGAQSAGESDVVRYCFLGTPTDWTSVSSGVGVGDGSGFLPTGRNASGSSEALALGLYAGRMAVFSVDAMQLWDILTNDESNAFYKEVAGVGTRYRRTPKLFAGDIVFLAPSGFRSVTTQAMSLNLQDVDVGSPIDSLVRAEINDAMDPITEFFTGYNQLWCAYPLTYSTTRIWVYSFSKSSKVAAWSRYEIPFTVDAMTSHNGHMYLRSGDNVYQVDDTASSWSDDGSPIPVSIEFPFLDMKTPGVNKYVMAMDLILNGTMDLRFRYDPNDLTKMTDPITITGNTVPGQPIPVEITAPAIAPVFTSNDTNNAELESFTFYYENLGAF